MRGKRVDEATINRVHELTNETTIRNGLNRFLSQAEIASRVGLSEKTVREIQKKVRGGSGSVHSTASPESQVSKRS